METFDYVIVGGGTAACVLANRLTADGQYTVLMLEAGGEPKSMWIKIPAGFTKLLNVPVYNWRFSTEPEEGTKGRQIAIPRGKGLGGSTLINGMVFVRGQPEDYDQWALQGATGWSAADVEPYFRKFETYLPGDAGRGKTGPMHVSPIAERYPLMSAFLKAAEQEGHRQIEDYNGSDQSGFGYYQASQKNGQRWTVVDGYINPARHRKNLTIRTGASVQKLKLAANRCTGVVYRSAEGSFEVSAKREVVMAAGAVQTPQILELSGVGEPALLQQYGIEVKHACPMVGENYIDHYATRMNWRVKNTQTLNELAQGWRLSAAVLQYFTQRKGILTLGTGLGHGFVKSRPDIPTPDVQYFFMHASYANAAIRKLDAFPGLTIGVAGLRPKSLGSIHIQSADSTKQPRIRPNFLAEQEDRDVLVSGMKIARRIVGQAAMSHYIDHEMSPGDVTQTDEQWLDFARENGQTIYHPTGTCRMGTDERSVVDPSLKFKGIDGLRVVDASVMPAMVSGNTQAAVVMVAEKGADLILMDAKKGE